MDRTTEVFADLYEQPLTEATVVQANTQVAEQIAPAIAAAKQQLIQAAVAHFGESGVRADGTLHWLHVTSTPPLTYYEVQEKRGTKAMDAIDTLRVPQFTGTAVHDGLAAYFQYTHAQQGLCNSHHLRELRFIPEQYHQPWASTMTSLLLAIKRAVDLVKEQPQSHLGGECRREIEKRYEAVVAEGLAANPAAVGTESPTKRRGWVKQSPPKNLLDRLQSPKGAVLAFRYDFKVPFDNNLAERDIRMIKVKQKVSGAFRTEAGAKMFCRIRGYVSTARKNGQRAIVALQSALGGNPFIPAICSPQPAGKG